MTNARIVLTTAGSAEEARKIAQTLVEKRLAACINIVPQVESVYRWEGKVETAAEFMLVIKTTTAAFAGVRAAIQKLHSYDVPECVMLEVSDGETKYLDWISASVD
jgi:periplasmic divalent cation tolerance protein